MLIVSSSGDEELLADDLGVQEISMLPIDHPGVCDSEYRARRNFIARLATQYREDPRRGIPDVKYMSHETALWRHVYDKLEGAHRRHASSIYLESKRKLAINRYHIPQLRSLDQKLRAITGFRLAPVEGLVETRAFLSRLGKRMMLCTQYLRHHSRPDYTPEPDIVHDIIGHVPNFVDPDFADFSQFIGNGATTASDEQLEQLGRLYWFTVEFGLVEEGSEVKAFGAGLLSSYSELEHAFSDEVERREFDLEDVIQTSYDYSNIQSVLFVIKSYPHLKEATREFIYRLKPNRRG
jgi:phenylalanine-4-hydroxylase